MKSIKPAARSFGRISRLLLLSLLLPASHSQAAYSASLTVKIRQLSPAGEVQQVTCADHKRCALPIDIQTGPIKETLTVHVLFVPGNALFEFETPKGFLYAGDKTPADKRTAIYRTIWYEDKAKNTPSTNVTLFLPLVPHAEVAPMLNTVQTPVADLEITTEAAP